MTTPAQAFAQAMVLPPAEAAAALAERDSMAVSWSWLDVYESAHASQFTVSRLARADLLQAIYNSLVRSVAGDLTRRDWMRDTRQLLQGSGWWGKKEITNPETGEIVRTTFDSARLKLIFDTNTRQSYSAGQWQRTVRNQASHPYIRYVTMRDSKVRPLHAKWDNVTLPVDHPFWQTNLPPNGWRCRCRWVAVTQAEYDRGYSEWRAPYSYDQEGNVTHAPPVQRVSFNKNAPEIVWRDFHNRSTGETVQTPAGVDPGFGYNPGSALVRQQRQLIAHKLAALDPAIAAAAMAEGLVSEKAFAKWLQNPDGEMPLVVIPAADAQAIGSNRQIAILSSQTAQKQLLEHPELTPAEYMAAQSVIDNATFKVQDGSQSMIYIRELMDDPVAGGHVLVVKTTRTGEGLFITSIRRLSREEARRDSEIARLMRKKK